MVQALLFLFFLGKWFSLFLCSFRKWGEANSDLQTLHVTPKGTCEAPESFQKKTTFTLSSGQDIIPWSKSSTVKDTCLFKVCWEKKKKNTNISIFSTTPTYLKQTFVCFFFFFFLWTFPWAKSVKIVFPLRSSHSIFLAQTALHCTIKKLIVNQLFCARKVLIAFFPLWSFHCASAPKILGWGTSVNFHSAHVTVSQKY